MDLVSIKKNIESGAVRTTAEFQRDMMLMFTNAIMYNNSDHNVFRMATEMWDYMESLMKVTDTQTIIYIYHTDKSIRLIGILLIMHWIMCGQTIDA